MFLESEKVAATLPGLVAILTALSPLQASAQESLTNHKGGMEINVSAGLSHDPGTGEKLGIGFALETPGSGTSFTLDQSVGGTHSSVVQAIPRARLTRGSMGIEASMRAALENRQDHRRATAGLGGSLNLSGKEYSAHAELGTYRNNEIFGDDITCSYRGGILGSEGGSLHFSVLKLSGEVSRGKANCGDSGNVGITESHMELAVGLDPVLGQRFHGLDVVGNWRRAHERGDVRDLASEPGSQGLIPFDHIDQDYGLRLRYQVTLPLRRADSAK